MNRLTIKLALIGYPSLLTTIIASASILPFAIYINVDNPLLKVLWRCIAAIPFMTVVSLIELRSLKGKPFDIRLIIKYWKYIIITALSLISMQIFYFLSGVYTLISHACLFTSTSPFFFVLYRILTRQPIHRLEYLGTIISIIGCVIMVGDQEAEKVDKSAQNIILGDFYGIIGGLAFAFFLHFNKIAQEHLPAQFTITLQVAISSLLLGFGGLLISDFTLDADVNTGIFGFLTEEYIVYTFCVLGLFTGAAQYVTLAISQAYFSPLIMSTAFLLEPLFGQLLGCWMEIDKAPGLFTYLGGFVTVFGLFFLSYGDYKISLSTPKQSKEDHTQLVETEIFIKQQSNSKDDINI